MKATSEHTFLAKFLLVKRIVFLLLLHSALLLGLLWLGASKFWIILNPLRLKFLLTTNKFRIVLRHLDVNRRVLSVKKREGALGLSNDGSSNSTEEERLQYEAQ